MDGRFKRQDARFVFGDDGDSDIALKTDGDLSDAAREVHRAFSRALQNRIANRGVSMGQWYFMRALWEEDGLTQRELSQRVGMMEPTTVTALNNLERCELVQRVRNPHDRRKVNIFLTPKGRALRANILPCADEIAELATKGIPPGDIATAVTVLRRVSANLSAIAMMEPEEEPT
ncbi:MarR family winged helix-turn-helix transcriptional regulator [Azospirillum sp. sgz302134]